MDRDPASFRAASSAAAGVTQLTVLVIGGTWAGSRLDASFGTSPVLLLLGAGVGTALGFFLLARGLRSLDTGSDHPDDDPPDAP